MIWVVVLGMAAAIALLWRRVDTLERELRQRPAPVIAARAPVEPAMAAEPALAPPVVEPASKPSVASPRRPRFDVEDVFGRMLPIWAGGVTLAVAGFFLVRWAIDAGLLTPAVRVLLAGLFGLALIAGAEAAFRWRERVADPRVAQALAGAGLATLYAAFYLAGTTYGLIGATLAFLGLAAVTAAAIGLSWRFGLPSAVLGLVGGFAAPALVGGEQANLPLLTLYLGLVTAGLAVTGRRQDRAWLGLASLAAGLGWGGLLVWGAARLGTAEVIVLGAYLVLLGAVVPALVGAPHRAERVLRAAAAGLAAIQLAVLVSEGGFGALQWSLYLLLAAALAALGWREAAMREGSALAAAVAVVLLALWPAPPPSLYVAVTLGLTSLFAGVPLAAILRRRAEPLDAWQVAGTALGLASAALWHFSSLLFAAPDPVMALALIALALLPAAATWALERGAEPGRERGVTEAAATLLAYAALAQVLPRDTLAWVAAAAAALLAWRAARRQAAIAVVTVIAVLWAVPELIRWLQPALEALPGTPLAAAALPAPRAVWLFLIPAAAACAVWRWLAPPPAERARAVEVMGALVALVAAHTLVRHGFAALAGTGFVATGLIQRSVWEALLVGAAWLLWRRGQLQIARIAAVAAAAHFVWFTLALHNPLWAAQAVGPLPAVNALLPAYAAGLAALLLLRRLAPPEPVWRWAADAAIMAVIAMFALSTLRQLFAGSLLNAVPVSQPEDLLRSLVGIVLAIAYLAWGARSGARSWRIGSLVLMVIAVGKVFLVDAAGLAGLARIASFMALGFSLIGIGWFYSRQLRAAPPAEPGPAVT